MTAVKGVNVTKYEAGGQGDNAITQGLIASELNVWSDSYEASGLAAASTIEMANLPAGAKVHAVFLDWDALGSSRTLAVGDSDDADRYLAATDASSAGGAVGNLVDGKQYVIGTATDDDEILVTTGGSTATGTIKLTVLYTL